MGKPYSDDLREPVVAGLERGMSCHEAGALFGIAPSTAGNWHRRHKQTQSVTARPMGGERRSKLEARSAWRTHRGPAWRGGATAAGRCPGGAGERRRGGKHFGRAADGASAWTSLQKTVYATEQDRPDIALARQPWVINQAGLDFERLIFVDETGTTTRMVRTHGWGRKGQRLIG
ncbi:MAG: IS630 family transposase, partial [Novosphingobium sp.]|nr:IS630 family transposase [Novosphingobium sp.]